MNISAKLSTVLGSTNENPKYYLFIPKQIIFWKKFDINFIAIFVGEKIPKELEQYKDNIILWNKESTKHINSAYVSQNIRIYYPALLKLPENEICMITDMDMLPTNDTYYKQGIDLINPEKDFIYYRNIDGNQIYMCYNAAHPSVWSNVFNIKSEHDIEIELNNHYNNSYNGIPGSTGWFIDQEIMYKKLINYPNLKVLNRPIKRLEMYMYERHLRNNDTNFLKFYDDAHFHRSYCDNEKYILNAELQL